MSTPAGPEAMRATLAAYVGGVMQAYADASRLLTPGDRARLPLIDSETLTVAVIGTRYLHLVGTADSLPPPQGPEVAIDDACASLTWQVRFFDPVIIPSLGLIDETEQARPLQVRDQLGIRTHVFHLIVGPGSGLTPHHAQHAGTGLAHAHAAAVRDFEAIANLAKDRIQLVQEMQGAERAGLVHAHALLSECICPSGDAPAPDPADPASVRTALLARLRRESG